MALGLHGITITGGYHDMGGAVALWGELGVEIDNCIFVGNTATENGGAIGVYAALPEIRNCRFEGNHAPRGGAFALENGGLRMSGTTFSDNIANMEGGALYLRHAYADTVVSCTFAHNEAPRGAGVSLETASATADAFDNCIFAFNRVGESIHWLAKGTLVLSCCDIFGNEGGDWIGELSEQENQRGNLRVDPVFCAEATPGQPHTLAEGSPCRPEANPACGLIGAWPVGCSVTAAVELAPTPPVAALRPCVPNPFRSATTVRYDLATRTRVGLRFFGVSGRLVRVLLAEEAVPAGHHALTWDGTDDVGRAVSAGVYFLRLEANGPLDHRCGGGRIASSVGHVHMSVVTLGLALSPPPPSGHSSSHVMLGAMRRT